MKNLIVTKKIWNKKNFTRKIKKNFKVTNNLNQKILRKIKPKIIFVIHWSKIIRKNIFSKFYCIQFHASHLPYGRGGSPIQNLILRGFKKTKISAFVIKNKKLDSGPILLQKNFVLSGKGNQIYQRLEKTCLKMVSEISKKTTLLEKKQKGKTYYFKRRKPNASNLNKNNFKDINQVYDFIRMLDAEGYPSAFVNSKNLNIKFKNAKLNKNILKADVEIELYK